MEIKSWGSSAVEGCRERSQDCTAGDHHLTNSKNVTTSLPIASKPILIIPIILSKYGLDPERKMLDKILYGAENSYMP